MNPQQLPLADIHTPAAVSQWPPAYGWWILAGLAIIALVWLIKRIKKRRAARVQRNFALDELNAINLNDFAAGQQINEVLKRAAMVYYSREQVAALSGEKWKQFLLQGLGKSATEFDDQWLSFGYAPTIEAKRIIAFHQFAQVWLSKALPPKSGVEVVHD